MTNNTSKEWEEFCKTRDPELKNLLIIKYIGVVYYAVKILNRKGIGLPAFLNIDDLVGFGIMGLIQAIERFDPNFGVKFETYALSRVKGMIIDELRKYSGDHQRAHKKFLLAKNEMEQKNLGPVSDVAVCKQLGWGERRLLVSRFSVSYLFSAVKSIKNNEKIKLIDTIPSDSPSEYLEEIENSEIVKRALLKLPLRLRAVLQLYYFENLNLQQIGELLNLSKSRISQLIHESLAKIKKEIEVEIGESE